MEVKRQKLGNGAGGEFRSPMAIAVIGGLLVSTLLSLLFVPAFFALMDDLGRLVAYTFARFIGKADERAPGAAANPLGPHPPDDNAGQRATPTPSPIKTV